VRGLWGAGSRGGVERVGSLVRTVGGLAGHAPIVTPATSGLTGGLMPPSNDGTSVAAEAPRSGAGTLSPLLCLVALLVNAGVVVGFQISAARVSRSTRTAMVENSAAEITQNPAETGKPVAEMSDAAMRGAKPPNTARLNCTLS